jgi:hypothetical protein
MAIHLLPNGACDQVLSRALQTSEVRHQRCGEPGTAHMGRDASGRLYLPTYEVGSGEPLHPDPQVVARMTERHNSTCRFGCKVYGDPLSGVLVLAHHSGYGCPL